MPYIQTKDNRFSEPVNLFYQDWSTSTSAQGTRSTQPTVVLIHGWPLSHEMWEYQMTELPKEGFAALPTTAGDSANHQSRGVVMITTP